MTHSETDEQTLFEGHPALIPSIGGLILGVLTVGLWFLPLYLRSLSVHYRVTTRRVVVETGIFSKRLEQVDLYRVSDYTVERPFGQRIMGTGNILLKTLDKTTPEVDVLRIKADVVKLYEQLRAATEAARSRIGARVVDYDQHE